MAQLAIMRLAINPPDSASKRTVATAADTG